MVVVGSYHTDLVVETAQLPDWGDDLRPASVRAVPGGKGLNQAVTLARTDAQVAAVGMLGTDPAGSALLATLAGEGIDVTAVARQPAAPTPVCLVFAAPDGRTAFVPRSTRCAGIWWTFSSRTRPCTKPSPRPRGP
jgi:ribokinase